MLAGRSLCFFLSNRSQTSVLEILEILGWPWLLPASNSSLVRKRGKLVACISFYMTPTPMITWLLGTWACGTVAPVSECAFDL